VEAVEEGVDLVDVVSAEDDAELLVQDVVRR
jgi:hypothetical protein